MKKFKEVKIWTGGNDRVIEIEFVQNRKTPCYKEIKVGEEYKYLKTFSLDEIKEVIELLKSKKEEYKTIEFRELIDIIEEYYKIFKKRWGK